jgi:hypothetical protein
MGPPSFFVRPAGRAHWEAKVLKQNAGDSRGRVNRLPTRLNNLANQLIGAEGTHRPAHIVALVLSDGKPREERCCIKAHGLFETGTDRRLLVAVYDLVADGLLLVARPLSLHADIGVGLNSARRYARNRYRVRAGRRKGTSCTGRKSNPQKYKGADLTHITCPFFSRADNSRKGWALHAPG